MSPDEKFAALKALAGPFNASLRMRGPGNWYVEMTGVEVAKDGMLSSPTQSATGPYGAIEEAWGQHADGQTLRVSGKAARFKWNGYMWEEQR